MVQNTAKEFYKILETIYAQARNGLAFSDHPYDIDRYRNILEALTHMSQLIEKEETLLNALSFISEIPVEIGSKEYVTPKVAVATVVFNSNDEILLVKRLDDLWTLPGGYADIPYDPIENANKEVREETGLEIIIKSLIGIYDSHVNKFPSIGRQVYLLVFLGKFQGGTLNVNLTETKDANFYSLQSLPELLPITKSQIQYGYRMYKGEILPPVIERNT